MIDLDAVLVVGAEMAQDLLQTGFAGDIPWGSVSRGPVSRGAGTQYDGSSELLTLKPGRVIALEGPTGLGLTRIGMSMLAVPSHHAPVVIVDVRGWVCPSAAWETGVRSDRLTLVRVDDLVQWPSVIAALLEGVKALYAEVPDGVPESKLRRLSAMARSRDAALVLRPLSGRLPAGIAFLRVRAREVVWSGARDGHGCLTERRMMLELSGKGAAGRQQLLEVEDDGADTLRVVSGLATEEARRAV